MTLSMSRWTKGGGEHALPGPEHRAAAAVCARALKLWPCADARKHDHVCRDESLTRLWHATPPVHESKIVCTERAVRKRIHMKLCTYHMTLFRDYHLQFVFSCILATQPPLHYELAACASTALPGDHFPNCRSLSPDRAGSGLSTHSHAGRRVDGASFCFLHSDARLAPWRQHSLP
jgi:hypothetical protein